MTTPVGRSLRHVRGNPCPVCGGWDEQDRGKGQRCAGFTSDDGLWCRCTQVESPHLDEKSSPPAWRHAMAGVCRCGARHGPGEMPEEARSGTRGSLRREPEATYTYRDAQGRVLCEVTRWPGKKFSQRRPDGAGGWTKGVEGVPYTLYRLPEALASSGTVYVVEGEKDVETLRKRGLTAVSARGGSNRPERTDWSPLRGREVTVIADADEPGRKFAKAVAVILRALECKVTGPVECTGGKDATEHAEGGGSFGPGDLRETTPAGTPTTPQRIRQVTLEAAPSPDIVEIHIGTDIERMTNQAVEAIAKDPRTYQRGGFLAGVIRIPEGPVKVANGFKRPPGSYVITTLEKPTVKERLSTVAKWLKYDGRSGGYKVGLPCDDAVSALIARKQWDTVRHIVGVVTAPQLRPDGTILQEPGYDASTGLLYVPDEDFPEVADRPTLRDAQGAIEALQEVVCDFPFASAAHESAWIAGLLTMLARAAIDGCTPMFAVDATTRGTGKSRLVDAASIVAHGRHSARTSLPADDEEMRKRITSLVLDADPMICLDNITKAIVLPSLDAAITSTVWKDRLLSKNATVTAPHRTVWWATGNNLVLGGDMSRRSLHIRLESALENPEERTGFKHPDLLGWVGTQRKRLVASGLTLLRAFTVAGMPYDGGVWGSFESWSKLICGAIAWAGATNPILARATQDPALDDEKRALTVLIDGLNRLAVCEPGMPVKPVSAKAIISALYPERDPRDGPLPPDGFEDLRDVIEQETCCPPGKTPEPRKLGKWLQRARGRVIGGWCIQRHEGANHTACWRAEPSGVALV